MSAINGLELPKQGDIEYITDYCEHIGGVQVKMVFDDGWWVSDEWLQEQKAKDAVKANEHFPLFD